MKTSLILFFGPSFRKPARKASSGAKNMNHESLLFPTIKRKIVKRCFIKWMLKDTGNKIERNIQEMTRKNYYLKQFINLIQNDYRLIIGN